jgi:hypothetical protein
MHSSTSGHVSHAHSASTKPPSGSVVAVIVVVDERVVAVDVVVTDVLLVASRVVALAGLAEVAVAKAGVVDVVN